MVISDYADRGECEVAKIDAKPPTIRENLLRKREQFTKNVERIDAVLKLLDDNRGFEDVHDAISSLGFLGLR
jgi:hypothetical protein